MKWPDHWRGATWKCSDEAPLTEAELLAIFRAIPEGEKAICRAAMAGPRGMASRRVDKAMRLMKKAGLAHWRGRGEGWAQGPSESSTICP